MSSVKTSTSLDATLTVNEVLLRWPGTVGTLNALGIHTCCGGADSLAVAAAYADVPVENVIAALDRVIGGGAAAQ